MLSALRRTISRSGHFLGSALAWRSPEGQYLPIVLAMIAGWIGLLASLRGDPSGFELACAAVYLSSVLVAVCAVDARYGIIPDSMVAALAVGGLVQTILASQTAPFPDLLQRIAEASIFLAVACAFRSLYRLIRGHHGLGFGDVKFATAGMLWVGIESA